jgi:CRP-like cAMP-binding protein
MREIVDFLRQEGRKADLTLGQRLERKGRSIVLVERGLLGVLVKAGEKELALCVAGRGAVFSDTVFVAEAEMRALRYRTRVRVVSERAASGEIWYSGFVQRNTWEYGQAMALAVKRIGLLCAEDRLLAQLRTLVGSRIGKSLPGGFQVDINNKVLGLLTGMSREAVSKGVGRLARRGLVEKRGRSVLVPWKVVLEEAT